MTLTVTIPDDLAHALGEGFKDLGSAALEALAAEAYSKDLLSLGQVRRMLGVESRWETRDKLCRHAVWAGQSAEEILNDAETSARFRAAPGSIGVSQ